MTTGRINQISIVEKEKNTPKEERMFSNPCVLMIVCCKHFVCVLIYFPSSLGKALFQFISTDFLVLVFVVDLFFWLKFLEMRHNQVPISIQPSFVAAANGSIEKRKIRTAATFLQKGRTETNQLQMRSLFVCALIERASSFSQKRKMDEAFRHQKLGTNE